MAKSHNFINFLDFKLCFETKVILPNILVNPTPFICSHLQFSDFTFDFDLQFAINNNIQIAGSLS